MREIQYELLLDGNTYSVTAGVQNITLVPVSPTSTFTLQFGSITTEAFTMPLSLGNSATWQGGTPYQAFTVEAIGGDVMMFFNTSMIVSGGSGSGGAVPGDATAANQVIEINRLTQILGSPMPLLSFDVVGVDTVPANTGAWCVTNIGYLEGTFNGVALLPGQSVSSNQKLAVAIPMDATGTRFRLDYFDVTL